LRSLDAGLAEAVPERPTSMRPWVLREEVAAQDAKPLKGIVDVLLRTADEVVEGGGGRTVAGFQRAFDDSLVLALAWSFAGDVRHAECGARIIGRVVRAGTAATEGVHYFLDAIRIFEEAGAIAGSASATLRTWLAARLEWLLTSPDAISERRTSDQRGPGHDLQVASVAAFLDDQALLYDTLARAYSRIRWQFDADGRPCSAAAAATLHQACLHMQRWIDLAELASRWGVDLWSYRSPEGGSLEQGAQWLLSRHEAVGRREAGFDPERLGPIRAAVHDRVRGAMAGPENGSLYAAKPLFPSDCGIRPFWSLASYGRIGSPPKSGV